MATVSASDEFVVFKFESAGVVALCQEVAQLIAEGGAEQFDIEPATARYRFSERSRQHEIVFDYVDKGADR